MPQHWSASPAPTAAAAATTTEVLLQPWRRLRLLRRRDEVKPRVQDVVKFQQKKHVLLNNVKLGINVIFFQKSGFELCFIIVAKLKTSFE